jgi:hypothetical protein
VDAAGMAGVTGLWCVTLLAAEGAMKRMSGPLCGSNIQSIGVLYKLNFRDMGACAAAHTTVICTGHGT